jgi:hypothetical protein
MLNNYSNVTLIRALYEQDGCIKLYYYYKDDFRFFFLSMCAFGFILFLLI